MTKPQRVAEPVLTWRTSSGGAVGVERIRLLEEIARTGSISAAAKAVGLSYKGAWDAVQAINNLAESPLVLAHTGGRAGGRAEVTAVGRATIERFRALSAALAAANAEDLSAERILRAMSLKTSARNLFKGVIESIVAGPVGAEVTLRVAAGLAIVAVVTRESLDDLGLAVGGEALALIKSSFVVLATGAENLKTSARNRFDGVVASHRQGAINDDVVLDLGEGKTLSAVITRSSAEALEIAVGVRVQAFVKASHVILAVA